MKSEKSRPVITFVMCAFLIVCALALGSCNKQKSEAPAAAGAANPYAGLPDVKWRLSNSQAPDHFYQIAYEHFADYVKEKSGGKFIMEIFHSGTLGTEQQIIENMQTGTIAGTLGAASLVANFVPSFNLFALPALFKDSDALKKVMSDETIVAKLDESCEAAGMYNYGYYQTFFRQLFSKKELKSLNDFRGQKIRVMGSPIIVNTFQALSCNPTTTAWTELYSALQLGVCDGLDHIASSVQSMAFYENLGYVCEPNLFVTPVFILFSKPMYDNLAVQYQELIDEAVEKVLLPELFSEGDKANDEAMEFLKNEGIIYVDCDVSSIQAAAAPVRDRFIEELEPWVQELARGIVSSN